MTGAPDRRIDLQFDDNRLVALLYGHHDSHLARIEAQLGVSLISRGNRLTVAGPEGGAEAARAAHSARAIIHPDEVVHFEYSTTSGVPSA